MRTPKSAKKHATYKPAQSISYSPFQTRLSANTLFPEAMDVLEMTGELHPDSLAGSASFGDSLWERFNAFCRHYNTMQVRWVEGALSEIGYYFLMQDTPEFPHPEHKTAIRLLKSLVTTRQSSVFLRNLGQLKQFCAQAAD